MQINKQIKKMEKFEIIDLIRLSIKEDLGGYGDITSGYLIDPKQNSTAYIICKQKDGAVLAGTDIAGYVFEEISPDIRLDKLKEDGQYLKNKDIICRINGPSGAMLTAERTALNFIQHMSGIATYTAKFSKIAEKYNVKITDTRKTKPGLRKIEKYAVLCGGGFNHRFGLFDGILIKDNHIAAAGSITKAISKVKSHVPHGLKIEVEVKSFGELDEAIACAADIIMLDNMGPEQVKKAVKTIRKKAPSSCLIEVSGGITLENVEAICSAGADIISAGCITHSAVAVDFSLEFE